MRRQTEEHLDRYWADRFGVPVGELWRTVSARPHGMLGDYPGFFVAWRAAGVHVSLPAAVGTDVGQSLRARPVAELQDPAFWRAFAERRGLALIGPSTHLYLDVEPGDPGDSADSGDCGEVVPLDEPALVSLRDRVPRDDWHEAGFDDAPAYAVGLYRDENLVAAANLNLFDGLPRDVGVLVVPAARGRGLAAAVARHATAYAVREHGFARWGARDTNVASLATARRLGFAPWCRQLAIR